MWSSLGVKFVSPELAMDGFDKLMHCDVDQIAVAIADWPTYAAKVGKPPFLAELVNGHDSFGPSKSAWSNGASASTLARSNDNAREELSTRLQQRLMAELGFVDPIDPDRPLSEVGLDSLRSVTLANNLEDEFGVLISISQLISGPTINQLVDHLSDLHAVAAKDRPVMAPAVNVSPVRNGKDMSPGIVTLQHSNGDALEDTAISPAVFEKVSESYRDGGLNRKAAACSPGKWLVAPKPNPDARARIFCFPYAGGGLVSFRAWGQLFDGAVELVAVEAPGRGTRINETAVDDMDAFVEGLLPEMIEWLDRPAAFFGHCLGGLTMFATLRALPAASARNIKRAFACGVRPPHRLKRRGEFEDNLAYDMMLHRDFDVRLPPFAQTDDIFADIIRQFDTPAANRMLEIPKLRQVLLPTIRAEFRMAYNYEYQPIEPFSFPISSFVGDADPWVSEEDSASWAELTRGGFTNHVCKGSHFLMAEDGGYILETINSEFANSVIERKDRDQ